jgi:hypothetical protein
MVTLVTIHSTCNTPHVCWIIQSAYKESSLFHLLAWILIVVVMDTWALATGEASSLIFTNHLCITGHFSTQLHININVYYKYKYIYKYISIYVYDMNVPPLFRLFVYTDLVVSHYIHG